MTDPLTPERWRLIEPILDAALELPTECRTAFVGDACAGDARLRGEVEALLAAEQQAGDFLETPHPGAPSLPMSGQAAPAGATAPERLAPEPGARVGPYRLLRELGHGGMGVVYLAERADGQFEQRVALKLIRLGVACDEVIQRFLRERQILARLQHPHIARLLDGGVTPDGQPYFTMEHVEGVPITRYAEEHSLPIEDRVALVLAACNAVAHAHAAGVVHRDIKPANLLVDGAGELKLLDFGIAKLLEDGDSPSATRTGLRVLTPEYAAPEQLRGEPVTPATDVHGLGVVLYELLTGRHPFRQELAETPLTIERRVLGDDPTPPSRRVGRPEPGKVRESGSAVPARAPVVSRAPGLPPDRRRRRLRGDLDAVVLRALEKDPGRRYGSAGAIAEDLRRHLAGRPVAARRGTTRHRLRRFGRRHVAGLRAAALAAFLLAGSAFVAGRQPDRTASGTALAAGAGTGSETALRMYEEGLRALHQQDMHGARRLFRAAVAEDSMFALAIHHALRAEWALALPPDRALEARLLGLTDRLPDRERLRVEGRIAWIAADPAAIGLAEQMVRGHPTHPDGHLFMGRALAARWELRRALPHLRRAVAMDSMGLRGVAADCVACEALAVMLPTLMQLDSLAAAERVAREWVRLQPASGRAWFALTEAFWWQGNADEALAAIRRAAPLAPANRYVPIYPAALDIRAGAFESADRLLREQARAGPPDVQSEALWVLIISLRNQGRLREALATAHELQQLRPDSREPLMAEAQVLFEMGRHSEAAALFDSVATLPPRGELERSPSGVGNWRSWHLTHVADARAAAGDTTGFEALADSIELLGARTLSALRQRLHHHVRGLLHVARGDTAAAARAFRRATPHPEAVASPFNRTNLEFARALLALNRPHDAIAVLQPATGWGLEAASYYATHTALHAMLGRAHEATGQPDSARTHYDWVLNAWRNADPELHAQRDDVRSRILALEDRRRRVR